jgi:flavorubredoxin
MNKKAAYFGSYGWSGGARRDFNELAEALRWEVGEVWEFQGSATADTLRQGEAFGFNFAESLKEGE